MTAYDLFLKPYESYETYQILIEAIAAIFGILSVFFSVRKNIWVYPTGIISTVLYVYILFVFGLLGDMMINFYYTVMSIYGWVLWSRSSEDHIHVEVSWATKKEWIISTVLFVVSLLLVTVVYYFKPYIDNHFSMDQVSLGLYHLDWANWLDVFTTAIFLVGMWLMARSPPLKCALLSFSQKQLGTIRADWLLLSPLRAFPVRWAARGMRPAAE